MPDAAICPILVAAPPCGAGACCRRGVCHRQGIALLLLLLLLLLLELVLWRGCRGAPSKGETCSALGVAGTEEERDVDGWGTGRGGSSQGNMGEV